MLYPFFEGGIYFIFRLLFFICLRSLGVFPILIIGWSSNCKYSILGSIRSVAQILSYEISLILILLILIWFRNRFNFLSLGWGQKFILNFFIFLPIFFIIFVSFLAELNRTPYDFREGESELVSGFNTEYGSGGFVLIFLREYANIIFIRFLISFIFFNINGELNFIICLNRVIIIFFIIWVRATLPRYRYDMLINLAWKRYLPLSLRFFCFYTIIFYYYLLF